MTRPIKPRRVRFNPEVTYFKPQGIPLTILEEISLTVDELEAIRLVDFESLDQIQAAEQMKISQPTLARIIDRAHNKIAEALVIGKSIRVRGGEIAMIQKRGRGFGLGRGAGGGRGRGGGPFSAGPGGTCVCTNPECKHEEAHKVGAPCYQVKCPKCGSPMVRAR